jgi:adenosylcobinamide-phosphate synthase
VSELLSFQQFAVPMYVESFASILLLALAFNLIVCRDIIMVKTFKSPLAMAGRFINTLEVRYNRSELTPKMLRNDGVATTIIFAFSAIFVGLTFDWLSNNVPFFWLFQAMALGTLFNLRTYLDQSRVLADAMDRSVEEGRATLALISGRDTETMDAPMVARSAVESSARTLAAGVMTPALYFMFFGSAGLFLFKTINIASSMIDERSKGMAYFGWGNARLNEMLLLPGGWATALILALSSLPIKGVKIKNALIEPINSAKNYFQKGSGHPVASIAGALNLKLGGPIHYDGKEIKAKWVGIGTVFADTYHVRTSRKLYMISIIILMLSVGLLILLQKPIPIDLLFF